MSETNQIPFPKPTPGVHSASLEGDTIYNIGKMLRYGTDHNIIGAPFHLQNWLGEKSPWLGAASGATAGGTLGYLGNVGYNWFQDADNPWDTGYIVPAVTSLLGGLLGHAQGASNQDATGKLSVGGSTMGSVKAGSASSGMAVAQAVMQDPSLPPALKQAVISALQQADPLTQTNLAQLVGQAGGAGIGFIVAKYLLGLGLLPSMFAALLGGGIGGFMMDSTPRNVYGEPIRSTSSYF